MPGTLLAFLGAITALVTALAGLVLALRAGRKTGTLTQLVTDKMGQQLEPGTTAEQLQRGGGNDPTKAV
jgi:hypothetical protein